MRGYFFKNRTLLTAAAVLFTLTAVSGQKIFAAESASARICEDDECVLISAGRQLQNVYDAEGHFVFDLHVYNEPFLPYKASVDTVFRIIRNEDYDLFSAKAGGRFLTVPMEDSQICLRGSYFMVSSRSEGISILYDCVGRELGRTDKPVAPLEKNYLYKEHLIRLEKGIIFGISNGGDACWMWADPAAGTCSPIQNDTLNELLGSDRWCNPMGNLLVFTSDYSHMAEGQEDDGGLVVSLGGEILLKHAKGIGKYGGAEMFDWWDERPVDYVLQVPPQADSEEPPVHSFLYDKELVKKAVFSDPDVRVEYAEGFIKGCVYPELENHICDGFVSVIGGASCPYFIADGWTNVLIGDHLEVFPTGPDEKLTQCNEGYYMTESEVEEGDRTRTVYRVYHRNPHNLIAETDSYEIWLDLGRDGLVVATRLTNPDTAYGEMLMEAYDLSGERVYSSSSSFIRPFDGYWYTRRGIYQGLTDIYGNWLVKTTSWKE